MLIILLKKMVRFWFGADPKLRFDLFNKDINLSIGENPLSPIIVSGFLVEWFYYLVLILAIVSPIFAQITCFWFWIVNNSTSGLSTLSMATLSCVVLYSFVKSQRLYKFKLFINKR